MNKSDSFRGDNDESDSIGRHGEYSLSQWCGFEFDG